VTFVPATPADRGTVAADLAAAFIEDPVMSWVFRDPAARGRYARHFFATLARHALPLGTSVRTEGGAALWTPPGRWRDSFWHEAAMGLRTWPGVGLLRGPRVALALLGIEARHPEPPHLYLSAIGVRPERRGGGVGSALLAPGLARADEHGLPAYLESSNPRNIPLYERHGFRVTGELWLPRGPVMTFMWRDP
jgi:ribosomal protein S18 acetylase RimI-like enzyme